MFAPHRCYRNLALALLAVSSAACAAQPAATQASAEVVAAAPLQHPFPGVTYRNELRRNPLMNLHIITVDLADSRVSVRVVPAGDAKPAPPAGQWQTTLQTVPRIAERERFDLAINGDFFASQDAVDPDGGALGLLLKGKYRAGHPASVCGPAMTDGVQWAPGPSPRWTLLIGSDHRARVAEASRIPAGVTDAIAGNFLLVKDAKPWPEPGDDRHARTAVGVDREGRLLTIVVADGLSDRSAAGVTITEMANEMARLGCYRAINLDGGGSTTLVMRDPTGDLRVLNHPTDGKPRPVASALGVTVTSRSPEKEKKQACGAGSDRPGVE